MATKRKKPAKKKAVPSKISVRGFGSHTRQAPGAGRLLSEPAYDRLYEWLRSSSHTNLRKVAVADFDGLRGVMALQPIAKGEEIVSIPAEFAVDLGSESANPLPAAVRMLQEKRADGGHRAVYWELLPQPGSPDLCTADFFSEEELQMLQWPPLLEETSDRSAGLQRAVAAAESGGGGAAAFELQELRWAVWTVLSRVLTVLSPDGSGHKLLIPFMDMFNHRAGCKHYLTGRTDGRLRLVAGEPVAAGEQVHILYGTEATSNAELLGHYGFVDPGAAAADRALVRAHPEAVAALRATTVAEDRALLDSEDMRPYTEQLALRFRIAMKKAAVREGLLAEGEV